MSSSSSPPPCSKAAGAPPPPPASNKYCLCAPTTHPGSFRCRLHRSTAEAKAAASSSSPGADQEATEAAAAAAVARELLERMARKPRRQGVPASAGTFRPGPSRLGATATAMDD